MSTHFSGDEHYNSSNFIETSIKMPMQTFKNNKLDYILKFRQLGDRKKQEAIIFLPSIYETEASCYRIAPLFEQAGYRFVSVTTNNHDTYEACIDTFDQFFKYLGVTSVHYIGVDSGGFLALQLQNTINFAAKCLSCTLINSYTRNDMFVPRKLSLFAVTGPLVAKSDLKKELNEVDQSIPELESMKFVKKELDTLGMSEAAHRIQLRMAMTPPLYLHIPPQAIMSIEPLDRRLSFTPRFLPSLTLGGVKQALMKHGSDFTHLEAPEDLFTYVLCHIKKWTPLTPEMQAAIQAVATQNQQNTANKAPQSSSTPNQENTENQTSPEEAPKPTAE
ncbi:hypothetical protein TVAG_363230 [Trichomonas vaginalis G3]|uniref:Maspardin n=1 Tax=Trichomonas vaginalis (strain ATCC PRA-98 / G3) TaxID=412133 RepID=A2FQI4_TRIV3|nr:acid cluster protein 33 family [Trichomonas vaginalis G3]EAX92845.1 hypothetical protein TVAG_363230 [Trichomonas vaginalis G3]KAI5499407.1 acid cluster protein 33 family [Trichomonas vaginalis G3]|eukprot:XP_001305775.1 hypothetical protein [Trichomonas vaginalis G3]